MVDFSDGAAERPTFQDQMSNNGRRPPHRFRPGQSGNPGGRPAGRSIAKQLHRLLGSVTFRGKPLPRGLTMAELLAEVLVLGALKGDFRYMKEIMDRTDGKVTDRVQLTGADGGAIEFDASLLGVAAEELEAWRKHMTKNLSNDDLDSLEKLVEKMSAAGPPPAEPERSESN